MQQMPIFGAIGAETLEFLLAPAPVVEVPAGDFFFHEDDPADGMYVLETRQRHGLEELARPRPAAAPAGAGRLLRRDGACSTCSPRSASVRADEDCSAIELTSANLYRLFERDVEQFALIQMNIGREMSRRLRITDDLLFRASMGEALEAPERI